MKMIKVVSGPPSPNPCAAELFVSIFLHLKLELLTQFLEKWTSPKLIDLINWQTPSYYLISLSN